MKHTPQLTPFQRSLYALAPPGLQFREDFVTETEAEALRMQLETLEFTPFEYLGWSGFREIASFGWRYDYGQSRFEPAPPIPEFLEPLRVRAATLAGIAPGAFEQALVIRYDHGAGIGWRRDPPVVDQVFGLSLLVPCTVRFRRPRGADFERFSLEVPPRSAYLLSGEICHDWEHSIAPLSARRYSITLRTRKQAGGDASRH